jgi:phenylpropionate dioxygenase-like ring-hydroxylating dioxygenase large terminal subunit
MGANIDRWQIIDFLPPSFVQIHVGGAETGTGAPEGRLAHGLNLWIMNAMTPETSESTHYFWAAVRDYAITDPEAGALIFDQVAHAFTEDKQILEAQQTVIGRRGDSWDVSIPADAGSVKSRRLLTKLIDMEMADTAKTTSGAPV